MGSYFRIVVSLVLASVFFGCGHASWNMADGIKKGNFEAGLGRVDHDAESCAEAKIIYAKARAKFMEDNKGMPLPAELSCKGTRSTSQAFVDDSGQVNFYNPYGNAWNGVGWYTYQGNQQWMGPMTTDGPPLGILQQMMPGLPMRQNTLNARQQPTQARRGRTFNLAQISRDPRFELDDGQGVHYFTDFVPTTVVGASGGTASRVPPTGPAAQPIAQRSAAPNVVRPEGELLSLQMLEDYCNTYGRGKGDGDCETALRMAHEKAIGTAPQPSSGPAVASSTPKASSASTASGGQGSASRMSGDANALAAAVQNDN